jgi:GNAT superfamily N-acetyltransferase
MTLVELERRMETFLVGEYTALIFEEEGNPLGYALFKREESWAYLRQFFVSPERRRTGIGRQALAWLQVNAWPEVPSVPLGVLLSNSPQNGARRHCSLTEMRVPPHPLRAGKQRVRNRVLENPRFHRVLRHDGAPLAIHAVVVLAP